jgi:hypothetical protein
VRVATRLVDAGTNDHYCAREPEQRHDADANAIAAQHAVAVAVRERHTDDRPCEPDANTAWTRPVLRC